MGITKMILREIAEEITTIEDAALSGDLTDEQVAEALTGLVDSFESKVKNIGLMMLEYDSKLGSIDIEIKRLQERKKSIQNRQEFYKDYLRFNMEQAGFKKIESDLVTVSMRKPSKVLVIDNEELIHDCYWLAKDPVLDKRLITKDLKDDQVIDGCHLEDGKAPVIIK